MNYPFYTSVLDLVANGSIPPSRFLGNLGFLQGTLHTNVFPVLWNLIGSHDTPRILHNCGQNNAKHRLAAALQLLWPGMPMIYYGDEVGLTGAHDPDCRRGMLWDPARQNAETLAWYKTLLAVRRECPVITRGRTVQTQVDDAAGWMALTKELDGKRVTLVFHCGTKADDGKVLTSGGRVLSVTGIGATLREAVDKAYAAIGKISFEKMFYRKDIAHRAFDR
jgi:glycosidase